MNQNKYTYSHSCKRTRKYPDNVPHKFRRMSNHTIPSRLSDKCSNIRNRNRLNSSDNSCLRTSRCMMTSSPTNSRRYSLTNSWTNNHRSNRLNK